jgi:hypothetical protein
MSWSDIGSLCDWESFIHFACGSVAATRFGAGLWFVFLTVGGCCHNLWGYAEFSI